MSKPVSVLDVMAAKGQRKLVEVTAYDYPTGLLAEQAEVDIVLVGDSLGMVVLGFDDTIPVTMEHMIHHCAATVRAAKTPLVVCDLPFMSYQASVEQACVNAGRLMKEGGAGAIKLEGGRDFAPHVERIVKAGIPVQGHLGLTPQSVNVFGGFRIQGKSAKAVRALIDDAKALEDAGAFSIVLEGIPVEATRLVTDAISIPTIGIGAGVAADGQVLVMHDLLGLFERFVPKFVKRFGETAEYCRNALVAYRDEVREGTFPGPEHTFHMPEGALDGFDAS